MEAKENSSSFREKEIAAIDRELEELEATKPELTAWEKLKGNKAKKAICTNLDMVTMDTASEKDPHWLITDYMPRYQITSLAGDGGSGKTTVWCAIAAAVSSGKPCFLLDGKIFQLSLRKANHKRLCSFLPKIPLNIHSKED